MSSRIPVLLLAFSIISCQEYNGSCPDIRSVTPNSASATESIVVEGSQFELSHADLWDEGAAYPPEVWFDVDLEASMPAEMMTPEEQAALQAMGEMTLEADLVVYESSEQLQVNMPDFGWSDVTSAAEMFGMEIPELPDIITEIPLVTTIRVINPSGCETEFDGSFSFVMEIPHEEGE